MNAATVFEVLATVWFVGVLAIYVHSLLHPEDDPIEQFDIQQVAISEEHNNEQATQSRSNGKD